MQATSVRTWGDPRRGGERGSPDGPAPGGQSRVRYTRKTSCNRCKLPAGQGRTAKGSGCLPLCCRTAGTSVEGSSATAAAFFEPDKTIISRSSTLAFGPAFYWDLITRFQVPRGGLRTIELSLHRRWSLPDGADTRAGQRAALWLDRRSRFGDQPAAAGDCRTPALGKPRRRAAQGRQPARLASAGIQPGRFLSERPAACEQRDRFR